MKVLIVERDVILLETMRDICSGEKLNPVITRNCEEAAKLLSHGFIPDLIICDEFLPTLSGEKWQSELALNKNWKEIPFVLMRGQRNKKVDQRPMELHKPFSIEDMLELFRKVRLSSQTQI